ncbi:hypothetical protein GOP47_0017819 [Adiantum capillus-veneris]|uniref:Uncharacterized protein n=1 Tax=Adiantum capillus-veneris TaxID=13818 RepID=A0A9D4UHA0_ADICA|nr:hypothetical protein GOP47_0017819 [Adiantum capillus-veneris]
MIGSSDRGIDLRQQPFSCYRRVYWPFGDGGGVSWQIALRYVTISECKHLLWEVSTGVAITWNDQWLHDGWSRHQLVIHERVILPIGRKTNRTMEASYTVTI